MICKIQQKTYHFWEYSGQFSHKYITHKKNRFSENAERYMNTWFTRGDVTTYVSDLFRFARNVNRICWIWGPATISLGVDCENHSSISILKDGGRSHFWFRRIDCFSSFGRTPSMLLRCVRRLKKQRDVRLPGLRTFKINISLFR